KDRHFVAPELSCNSGWYLCECYRAGTYRVIPENRSRAGMSNRNKSFGASSLVILPRVAAKVIVQSRYAAVEICMVVNSIQRLLVPVDLRFHTRFSRRRAAALNAPDGVGGCSKRSSTRALSLTLNSIRACRAT